GSGATISASTEQTLYGINHSGNTVNINFSSRPEVNDGLFYSMSSNGDRSPTDASLRDFGVYQGSGVTTPPTPLPSVLKTSGFTSQLGPNFDNADPGFAALFPTRAAFPNLPVGSPANQWNQGEVRQVGGVISQYLNGTLISQYINNTAPGSAYTSGDIMFGYWDTLSTIGQPTHSAIFDNIRVTVIPEPSALALGGIAAVLGAFVRRRKA
ncbi:MAG: PEP-CTERM sorting domain-containing protein, partial [Acidimicrobiales bacterium]